MTSVELGKGAVDLHAFVKAIMASDYMGWATVEFDEGVGRLPAVARSCQRFVEQELDLVL
jgi:sugar phosphate isomerase/epimerase